jgi:hypothetical protein
MLLCLDFDGTLTNREGSALVFGDFYKSLEVNPTDSYKSAIFKSNDEIQAIFQEKFGNPFCNIESYKRENSDVLISRDAWNFLHQALGSRGVSINIITKNRADYIRHVLIYQGFTEDEVSRINIDDSGKKFDAAMSIAQKLSPRSIIICDDSLNAMKGGVLSTGYNQENIALFNANPGKFNWSGISQQLMSRYQPVESVTLLDQAQARLEFPSVSTSAGSAAETFVTVTSPNFDLTRNSALLVKDAAIEEEVTPVQYEGIPRQSEIVFVGDLPKYTENEVRMPIFDGRRASSNTNSFFNPKVIIPAILFVGCTAGAIATGLVGVHLTAPIVLGVLAALTAILAIMMYARNTSPQYTSL